MSKVDTTVKKIVLSKIFWVSFCLLAFLTPLVRSVTRTLPEPPAPLYSVGDFELIDENSESFTRENLLGKYTVVQFIFTSCPTICPRLIDVFSRLQKRVRGLGQKAQLLSLTVDPETDTPEHLFRYARKVGANPHLWRFVTGDMDEIRRLIVNDLKVPLGDGKELKTFPVAGSKGEVEEVDLYDITHSGRLVLVDSKGQVRGYYDTSKDSLDQLMRDMGLMANLEVFGVAKEAVPSNR